MWLFIAATFPLFWRGILIIYLMRAHYDALMLVTRLALRAYLASLGLVLLAVAAASLGHVRIATATITTATATAMAPTTMTTTTLPAQSLGFWVAWYALVLLGCCSHCRGGTGDGAILLAAALLGWALAQPDVLRMLDFGLVYLGAVGLAQDGAWAGGCPVGLLRNAALGM